MQFQSQARPSIGIIYDFDAGASVDGALALAMLNGMEGKSEARLLSTSTTRSTIRSAAFCEAIARFFTPPPAPGAMAGFQRPAPPIGMLEKGGPQADTAIIRAVLDKKSAAGTAVYSYSIRQMNDTADPVALIRNAMTAQVDGNCSVVLAGPATNLAHLLALPDAAEWIKRKVRVLVAAIADPRNGAPDAFVAADVKSAQRVFDAWPGPIVVAGPEVGEALPFPGGSIAKDFSWVADHPVVDAYISGRQMPYDAPARAMAAIYFATHSEGYFTLSQPGSITFSDDGRSAFSPSAGGRVRYLQLESARKDEIVQAYVALASARPTPRAGRGRGFQNQNQNQQQPPAKKQEI